jgi:TRAP-type C4-dicarboxylate transport system substrate-binding protein
MHRTPSSAALSQALRRSDPGRRRDPYPGGTASSESELVKAIAAGNIDGGRISVRAFAAAGIPGLAAVEAPMTITSYAADKELATGDAADLVTRNPKDSGIKGLGLAMGQLRCPFGVREYPHPPRASTDAAAGQ